MSDGTDLAGQAFEGFFRLVAIVLALLLGSCGGCIYFARHYDVEITRQVHSDR